MEKNKDILTKNSLSIKYEGLASVEEGLQQTKIDESKGLKFSVSEGSLRTNEQVLDTNYTDEELSHLIKGKDFTNKEMSVQKFARKYATKEENQTLRRLWLGKVSDEFADKVFADIGEDIHGRSLVLTSNWLYHTFKRHGETAYKIQGNAKPTDVNMINHIADIIENYDRCHYDPNGKYGKTLTFETDSDGGYKYNGFSLISEKIKTNKILVLADVYTYKGKQKGVSRPLNDTKMPLNRTAANNAPIERAPSINNISNSKNNVNNDDNDN